jgi:hypothetical protein
LVFHPAIHLPIHIRYNISEDQSWCSTLARFDLLTQMTLFWLTPKV